MGNVFRLASICFKQLSDCKMLPWQKNIELKCFDYIIIIFSKDYLFLTQ